MIAELVRALQAVVQSYANATTMVIEAPEMIKSTGVLVSTLLMLLQIGPVSAQASREISPAGVSYTLLYLPSADEVAVQLAWPNTWAVTDGINQAVPYVGVAAMMQTPYPTGGSFTEAAEYLEAEGASTSFWMTGDHLHVQVLAPRESLLDATIHANDQLTMFSIDEETLSAKREEMARRIADLSQQDINKAYDALRWSVLRDAPLREALSFADAEGLHEVAVEDVMNWYRVTVMQTAPRIVVAGALGSDDAGIVVDRLTAGLSRKTAPPTPTTTADFSPKRILLNLPDVDRPKLIFLGRLPPTSAGHEYEDIALISILKHQMPSHVGGRRLQFQTFIDGYGRNIRFLVLIAEIDGGDLEALEDEVRETYRDFMSKPDFLDLARFGAQYADYAAVTASMPEFSSLAGLMADFDGLDPSVIFQLNAVVASVDHTDLTDRSRTAFPSESELIMVGVSSDKSALPDACLITLPTQAKDC